MCLYTLILYFCRNGSTNIGMSKIFELCIKTDISSSDVAIKDIEFLSVRVNNALSSIRIFTLADLLMYIKKNGLDSLLKVRNLGKSSFAELEQFLLKFGDSQNKVGQSCTPIVQRTQIIPPDKNDVIYLPDIPLRALSAYCDQVKDLADINIHTTTDLFAYCYQNNIGDLYKLKDFTTGPANKIMSLLSIMHDRSQWHLLYAMSNMKFDITPIACHTRGLLNNVNDSNLTETALLIQRYFTDGISTLSIRSQNILRTMMPNFGDVITLSLLYKRHYKCIRNCGINTWKEIISYAVNFWNNVDQLIGKPLNRSKARAMLDKLSYRTIDKHELNYIENFYNANGHLPMFYVLSSYIHRSGENFEKLYRLTHGILCDQMPLRTIKSDMSYERCRQLMAASDLYHKHHLKNHHITDIENWEDYHLDNILYITQQSDIYKRAKNEQLQNLSFFAFGYLCKLVSPFQHLKIGDNHYFIAKHILDCFDIKRAVNNLKKTLTKKVYHDTVLSAAIFVEEYWKKNTNRCSSQVTQMICDIISENFDVVIDESHKITIPQKTINVSTELYEIVKNNGCPMVIEDIFKQFKQKYPNHRFNNMSQIRQYLVKHNSIRPIGKTSCYALKEWNTYTGTIRNLIYDILSSSPVPLTAKEIHVHIQKIYVTTPKNIRSSIVCDKSGKFVLLRNGYIGISSKSYPNEYYEYGI